MAYSKKSLAETVCQHLREAIIAGRWRDTLPGIRTLCGEIQVSRQTMLVALRLLEDEGYVLPAAPGKARVINAKMIGPKAAAKKKSARPTIAIIASLNESLLSRTDESICRHLRQSITSRDFVHKHIAFPDITFARGAKNINDLIAHNPADIYIVLGAHAQCAMALKKLDVPVVYLGGGQSEKCSPLISYSLHDMCQTAMNHLVSIGHRRITVLLSEIMNSASMKKSIAEGFVERIFKSHKLPFSTYNCPRWGKTKQQFNATLEHLFSLTPPTVLILGDVSHVPRVVSFLLRRGLKYPEDVSLLVLDQAPELQEYDPPISYMKKSTTNFAKIAFTVTRKLMTTKLAPDQKRIVAPAELVVTDSISDVFQP